MFFQSLRQNILINRIGPLDKIKFNDMKYKVKANLNDWGKKLLKEDYATVIRDFNEDDVTTLSKDELIDILKKEVPIDLFNPETACVEWVDTDFKVDDVVCVYISEDSRILSHVISVNDGVIYVDREVFINAAKKDLISREDISCRMRGGILNEISFSQDTGLDMSRKKNKWKIVRANPREALSYWKSKKARRTIEKILMIAVSYYHATLDDGDYNSLEVLLDDLKEVGIWDDLSHYFNNSNNWLASCFKDHFNSLENVSMEEFDDDVRAQYDIA